MGDRSVMDRWLEEMGIELSDEVPCKDGPYWVKLAAGGGWRAAWLERGAAAVGDSWLDPRQLRWGPRIGEVG